MSDGPLDLEEALLDASASGSDTYATESPLFFVEDRGIESFLYDGGDGEYHSGDPAE